jgi:pilus assembly protein FimV
MGGLGSAGDPARTAARIGGSENRNNNGVKGGRLRMSKILRSLVAGLLLAVPAGAWAAGLGKLTILSALGQPLNAEVELVSVQKDELGSLNARLGSPDAYRQANIQFNSALTGARATVERRAGGQPYIKVVSSRPVNEPFIDLLIELSWNAGRLVREYTALIDPPGFAPAEPVAGTAVAASPAAPVAKPLPPQATSPVPAAPAAAAPTPAAPSASEYGPVKRGDTLRKIAEGVRPQGVTIEQTLVGLFRSNKDAFIDNNMNRLRTGKVLRVPTQQDLAALPQTEAANEIRVQTTDFNAYRQRVAGAVPEVATDAPRQSAAGKISTTIEDKAAAQAPGKEVLRLSKGESPKGKPAAGDGKAMADRVRALEEEATAREKSLKESAERIAQLEAMIKKMQAALELKSQSMAEAQKSAAAAKPEVKPLVDKAAPKPEAKPAPVAEKKDPAPKAADPVKPPEPAKAPEPPKAAEPAKDKPSEPPKADVAKADAPKPDAPKADEPKADAPKADAPKAADAPKPKPKVIAPPPPPPKKDFVDEMLDEPLVLAGGGGALALAGGLGFWALRRRKAAAGEAEDAASAKSEPKLSGAAGAAAAAAAAASAEPVMPAAPAATDDVDPIAEADVYIAYGRDAQAEEILKEALSKSPERDDIKVKLLEIYASRKSAGDFNRLAGEVHGSTGGTGDRWQKVAQMGYGLDPENPLYEAGRGALSAVPAATAAGAPTTDIDLDFDLDMSAGGGSAPTTITDFPLDAGPLPDDVVKTAAFAPGETMKMVQQGAAGVGEEKTVAPIMPDFDLGTDASTAAQTDVSMSPVAPATIQADALDGGKDDGNIIDFNFDETTPVPVEAGALAGGGNMETTMVLTPDLQAQASDLGIELDLGAEAATVAAPPTEISATTPAAGDDLKFDFDLPVAEAPAPGQTSDMDKTIATQAFDLGTISLDLNSDAGASISAEPGKDSQWYDVQTKFDLAKAYQEMGDKEGAQEILREVIREGDAQQKAEAEALLSTLG